MLLYGIYKISSFNFNTCSVIISLRVEVNTALHRLIIIHSIYLFGAVEMLVFFKERKLYV